MNDILWIEILEDKVLVYMDDILIFAETIDELRQKTLRILENLRKNDLYLKPEKCVFEVQEVEFLRHIIWPNQFLTDPIKKSGISEWPTPRNLKDVQSWVSILFRRKANAF